VSSRVHGQGIEIRAYLYIITSQQYIPITIVVLVPSRHGHAYLSRNRCFSHIRHVLTMFTPTFFYCEVDTLHLVYIPLVHDRSRHTAIDMSDDNETATSGTSLGEKIHLPLKLGQPSSSSPRTQSKRQRFTGLFSALSLISPAPDPLNDSSDEEVPYATNNADPVTARGAEPQTTGGIWGWLSPSKKPTPKSKDRDICGTDIGRDDALKQRNMGVECFLARLPDELYVPTLTAVLLETG
jgi:hypothetical protein